MLSTDDTLSFIARFYPDDKLLNRVIESVRQAVKEQEQTIEKQKDILSDWQGIILEAIEYLGKEMDNVKDFETYCSLVSKCRKSLSDLDE